jgi:hypothetical protein
MGVQETNRLAGCHPALQSKQKGWRASNELFNENLEPSAYASSHRGGYSGILLCSASGIGVFESGGLRPSLAHALKRTAAPPRRSARLFNSNFIVAFQTADTAGKRCPRERQRRRCGKQHRHDSKQSEYITLHELVPRLALIELVYHDNQGWQGRAAHDYLNRQGPQSYRNGQEFLGALMIVVTSEGVVWVHDRKGRSGSSDCEGDSNK